MTSCVTQTSSKGKGYKSILVDAEGSSLQTSLPFMLPKVLSHEELKETSFTRDT